MRFANLILYCALLGAVWSSEALAEVPSENADGWHTWQVDEPGVSADMCCFSWQQGKKSRGACNLDGRSMSFSNDGDCSDSQTPGSIQVYVNFDGGRPKGIHILSSNCDVSTESKITDHGVVSSSENLSWFRSVIEDKAQRQDVREEALFALVLSQSDAAYDYLDGLLTQR